MIDGRTLLQMQESAAYGSFRLKFATDWLDGP